MYAIGIILTTLYLVAGLGGVVWFVLCHMEDSEAMTKLKELYLLKVSQTIAIVYTDHVCNTRWRP